MNPPRRASDAVAHAAFCGDRHEHPSQNEAEIHPSFTECCINKPRLLQVTSLCSNAGSSGFRDYMGRLYCQTNPTASSARPLSSAEARAKAKLSCYPLPMHGKKPAPPLSQHQTLPHCHGSKPPFTELHRPHGPPVLPNQGSGPWELLSTSTHAQGFLRLAGLSGAEFTAFQLQEKFI